MTYNFSVDWFSGREEQFRQIIGEVSRDGALRVLEVGSFEGRSACWFSDNWLGHLDSRMVCVDTFKGNAEHPESLVGPDLHDRFLANVNQSRSAKKICVCIGRSQIVLPRLLGAYTEFFDLIYIDGSHRCSDVTLDGTCACLLLRPDGAIVFDDYHRPGFGDCSEPDPVRRAAEAVVTAFHLELMNDSPLMRAYRKPKGS